MIGMKKFTPVLFLLALLPIGVFAQAETPKAGKREQEVRTVLKLWAEAIVSRDMSALDKLFSEDVFITDHNGGTRGKKEEMEALKPSPGVKTVSVDNEDVRIRIYDKTAVVTAIVKMRFEIGGKETQIVLRYTAVFVKKTAAGRSRFCRRHASSSRKRIEMYLWKAE